MLKRAVQEKILRKLMSMKPPKWGHSHTEEKNLVKGLPMHLRGDKTVKKAIQELYKLEFLLRFMKTNEWHVSLNPHKKAGIFSFLGLPPRT